MKVWKDITKEIEFKVCERKAKGYYFFSLFHEHISIEVILNNGDVYIITPYKNKYRIKYDKDRNFRIEMKYKVIFNIA